MPKGAIGDHLVLGLLPRFIAATLYRYLSDQVGPYNGSEILIRDMVISTA